MKIALITGITGQDGSYLAELLLQKGYVVHWHQAPRQQLRPPARFANSTARIGHLYQDPHLSRDSAAHPAGAVRSRKASAKRLRTATWSVITVGLCSTHSIEGEPKRCAGGWRSSGSTKPMWRNRSTGPDSLEASPVLFAGGRLRGMHPR